MTTVALKSDCSNCTALCCVSLAFDKGDQFAIDKPAGTACPNLGADHRCTIHKDLATKGFNGCIMYDCNGAGQRVTQEVFQGKSWRDDPKLLVPMMDAFRVMRLVHDLLVLLGAAENLPLTSAQHQTLAQLKTELQPAQGWTRQTLSEFEIGPLPRQVNEFVKSLATFFPLGRSNSPGSPI